MSRKSELAISSLDCKPTGPDTSPRRQALRLAVTALAASVLSQPLLALARSEADPITVWKHPDCGCCKEWVAHLQQNGFRVMAHDVKETTPIRSRLGMPAKFGSCHTAQLGPYVVEGHVPAREIKRLLRERLQAVGLAVPGMPVGSPGMEVDDSQDAYDVLLVMADGKSRVYQSYPSKTVKSSS